MDPNPLQYQQVDENEPLYRAAMLSGVAVGIIILLVLGINFVVRHANASPAPTVKRDYETSPDDTVNGMRQAMADETGTGMGASSAASGSGSLPSQRFASTTGQQPGAIGGGGGGMVTGLVPAYGGPAQSPGYHSGESPSVHHTNASAMRDWASLSPENLADLLTGR
jgi:hypothetical protein